MSLPQNSDKFARRLRCYKIFLHRELQALHLKSGLRMAITCIIAMPLLFGSGFASYAVKPKDKPENLVPVAVADVTQQDMPQYLTSIGTVTPIDSVTVKTQINGQLLNIYFKEGDLVKAKSRIAQIDPRPYEAQLIQYRGQLMKDRALLKNARIDLERYKVLYDQDSISQQILETQESLVQQYEGNVEFDIGQIAAIKVNLIYCDIISPIDGRIGLLQVDPGNFVQTSDVNGIVVINTVDPIYVVFTIVADNIPQVVKKINAKNDLIVEAQDRTQKHLLATGKLYTLDNQIDTTTGTVKAKAIFTNKDNTLFANQFVNTRLLVDTIKNATVVPTPAIQYGANGNFVFVVQPDKSVAIVHVSLIGNNESQTAVTGDIKPGQQVVIEGLDKLKQGSKVAVIQNSDTVARK